MQNRGSPKEAIWALGLMSGTSMDGIDAAIIKTDGVQVCEIGPGLIVPYDEAYRLQLKKHLGKNLRNTELEREIARRHAKVVKKVLNKTGHPVSLIGFHGQTVYHVPPETLQLGDGKLLAEITGIPVVSDFRTQDCFAGGQGAPLVPIYHQALCQSWLQKIKDTDDILTIKEPIVVLNIGGVSNLTYMKGDDLIGFDTGPGNALIDDFMMRELEQPYDLGGKIASLGKPHMELLQKWLSDPYFTKPYPKSLDRDHFQYCLKEARGRYGGIDGLATLTAFTAFSVFHSLQQLPQMPKELIVCGGGRKNLTILHWLKFLLKECPVINCDELGWDGDLLEAQAFAFLAVRSLRGLPLSFPGTTGVKEPCLGGQYIESD